MQEQLFKVRDKRNKGWFWIENEYFNGFGKILGGLSVAVYVCLCRHADQDQKCFPSQKEIARELKMGERKVREIIKQFEKYRIIEIERNKDAKGKWLHNIYWLLDKTEWIHPEAYSAYGKPRGIKRQTQRHTVPTNKTHINNTHIKSNYKMFYHEQPVIKDYGKLYVLQNGDKILFTGKESEIEYKN